MKTHTNTQIQTAFIATQQSMKTDKKLIQPRLNKLLISLQSLKGKQAETDPTATALDIEVELSDL